MGNKVSIIVPIYNVEKYIEKCLKSLISQTYKDIEIFAVIDGSKDNSVNIVREYIKKDKRIICIEKENGGYGSVLELAIKTIKTEYFLICDPDDWLKENAVEELMKAANENRADIVVADKINVYSNDNSEQYCSSSRKNYEVEKNYVLSNDERFKAMHLEVSPHSKLFKTNCVKGLVFPKYVNYTDFLLYMYAIKNANRVIYIDKPLAYYLIDREGNTSTDKSYKSLKSQIVVYKEIINNLKDVNNNNYYYRMYIQYRYPILNTASRLSKQDYNTIKKELFSLFDSIENQKEIINNIKFNNIVKQIFNKTICMGLFSKIFRNMTITFIIKLNRYKNRRNK